MQVIKQEIRNRILASAEREFAEKGYSAASVRQIAANAATSTGNLYKYYSGKEELFLAVVLPTTDECIGMVERTFDVSDNGIDECSGFMADYVGRKRNIFVSLSSGPAEHYFAFLNRFTACISGKLREYAFRNAPEAAAGINNPSFFDGLAAAYVGALRPIMEHFTDSISARMYTEELMRFMFGDFCGRLNAIYLSKERPE